VLAISLIISKAGRSPEIKGPHRALVFVIGLATGFLVPVLPFAAASPSGFYQSLVVAQIGPRHGAVRIGLLDRLYDLAGLADVRTTVSGASAHISLAFGTVSLPQRELLAAVAAFLLLAEAGGLILLNLTRDRAPTPLEWFAFVTAWLVTVMFLWPSQFHYHFGAFLAPFLALAVALPLRLRRRWAITATVLMITVFAGVQARAESELAPGVPPQAITAAKRLVPPGSCLVSDSVTLLLLANRFDPSSPGCTLIDDGLGTDLALSPGLTPATGAGHVPAVARLWFRSISQARFLWLSRNYRRRIPDTPALSSYLRQHFTLVYADRYGDTLARRVGR
jgi:hypothetical protein